MCKLLYRNPALENLMTEQDNILALEATKFQEVAGSIPARSLKSATTPPFNSPLKHTEEQKAPLPLKPGT